MNAHVRRSPWRRPLFFAVLAALLLVPFTGCGEDHSGHTGTWHCPMHPTYTSDRPGNCPICSMKLVPLEERREQRAASRRLLFYRHPMNPAVTSPVPAQDEMGMAYVPVYSDGAEERASPVPGLATVEISVVGLRLAGVRTAPVVTERLAKSTRTVGTVTADERRVRHVHTKIGGWVEKLHVNTTGQMVRAGQPILALYSPELLASQEELIRARQAAARFAASSIPEVRRGAEDLVVSARRRLALFDVPESFLNTLEETGRVEHAVTLMAPASGFVTTKQVFEGMEVEPGTELFTLTDLSWIWVEAAFYENEARFLALGREVEVRLPYQPELSLAGKITFIDPTLSPESRTLRVRLELGNRDGHLKPGMYVDVLTDLEGAEGLTVPEDAVIESGLRQLVFVELEPGLFEPREVRTGVRGGGRVLLLEGVRAGEQVATRANFLLDSESKLRAAVAAAAPASAGHVH